VTVIVVRICCCIPNFIKIGSRVWPPDAHNCWMSSVPLPGNGRWPLPWQPHYGGHVGNVMGCDQPSFVPIGPLLGELWYFQYFSTILKILIFDHMTVMWPIVLFIDTGSRVRLPDAHNCRIFNAPLLGNGRCHGNRIIADMSRTWWHVTTQVASQSVHW